MDSDKPFKCPKCEQRFANSDRLVVHQLMHLKQRLQVKIPGGGNDISVADQTPTPSSFLKTADVEGSPLFQELNPFDRDFKLASNSPQSVGEHSKDHKKNEVATNDTENFKVEEVQEFNVSEENVLSDESCFHGSEVDDSVSSTTQTATSTIAGQHQHTSEVLQSLLSHIQSQKSQEEEEAIKRELSAADVEHEEVKTTLSGNQDALREQLKSLLNSGLIKIQITPYPASTKVQATIVGNVTTTKTTPRAETAATTVTPGIPRIAPKMESMKMHPAIQIEPASLITTPSVISSQSIPSVLPGTNLQIAKQKLKQVIVSNTEQAAIERITMAASPMSHTSSQGKYKDIILEDELCNELGKRRGRSTSGEEYSPQEKRRRFLERNRAAASRCRHKRRIWVNQLEKKSEDLVATNQHLITEISALRNEVAQLKALLLAHKDCPVTLQQKALVNQITSGIGAYVAVSDGQLITLQQFPPNSIRKASDEEVASSALTDMAARATIELDKKATSGVVTVQASSLLPR